MIARPVFVAMLGASLLVLFLPGSDVPTGVPVNDKLVHAGMFLLLTVSGRWAGLPLWSLALELAAYALLSEVLQGVLPIDRDFDLLDALADWIGIAVGALLAWWVPRLAQKR